MANPRKRHGETREEFIERASLKYYSDGYHISEIASKLKCDIIEVYRVITNGCARRVTTSDERDLMISMHKRGWSYSKIAKELGRSRQCVANRINSAPKCHIADGYHLSDREIEKIKKWHLEGRTLVWIGRQVKCSACSIKRRLYKAGIYKFDYTYSVPLSSKDKDTIKKMHKAGYTIGAIAGDIGRHPNLISKYIKDTFK